MRARLASAGWLIVTTMVVVALFVAATLYAGHVAASIDAMAENIAGNAHPSLRHLSAVREDLHAVARILSVSVVDRDQAPLREELERREQHMNQAMDDFAAMSFFPTERGRWQIVDLDLREVEARADELAARIEAHDVNGAFDQRVGPVADTIRHADVALEDLIAFEADKGSKLGAQITEARHRARRAAYLLDGLAVVFAVAMVALGGRATQQHVRALRLARDAESGMTRRLQTVAAAAVSISERVARSEEMREVLRATVEAARSVGTADVAALGARSDSTRPFDPFVFAGAEASMMSVFVAPHPRGAIDAAVNDSGTVLADDLGKDPRFAGAIDRRGPLGPFLGVALQRDHEAVGLLYLGRKPGAAPFTEQDARAVELLAAFAVTAMRSGRLYAALHREVRAREDILSIVSHDLRNPLSAVSMAAGVLRRAIDPGAPSSRHVDVVARNAARMDRMITDLLTATMVQEGKLSVVPKAQEAAQLVAEAIDELTAAASDKGVELRADVARKTPPVYCDGGRVVQVLSNLIGNALKFTPRGGSIVASAEPCDAASAEVCFSVRDTGVGIPEDAVAHVFDRYWRKPEHAAKGTGLGLFIAKGIVESHHGRIWVTSTPGKGSDFRFTLPAAGWPLDASPAAGP